MRGWRLKESRERSSRSLPSNPSPILLPTGLRNEGNSCFFNALIQTFFHAFPKFRAAVIALVDDSSEDGNETELSGSDEDSTAGSVHVEQPTDQEEQTASVVEEAQVQQIDLLTGDWQNEEQNREQQLRVLHPWGPMDDVGMAPTVRMADVEEEQAKPRPRSHPSLPLPRAWMTFGHPSGQNDGTEHQHAVYQPVTRKRLPVGRRISSSSPDSTGRLMDTMHTIASFPYDQLPSCEPNITSFVRTPPSPMAVPSVKYSSSPIQSPNLFFTPPTSHPFPSHYDHTRVTPQSPDYLCHRSGARNGSTSDSRYTEEILLSRPPLLPLLGTQSLFPHHPSPPSSDPLRPVSCLRWSPPVSGTETPYLAVSPSCIQQHEVTHALDSHGRMRSPPIPHSLKPCESVTTTISSPLSVMRSSAHFFSSLEGECDASSRSYGDHERPPAGSTQKCLLAKGLELASSSQQHNSHPHCHNDHDPSHRLLTFPSSSSPHLHCSGVYPSIPSNSTCSSYSSPYSMKSSLVDQIMAERMRSSVCPFSHSRRRPSSQHRVLRSSADFHAPTSHSSDLMIHQRQQQAESASLSLSLHGVGACGNCSLTSSSSEYPTHASPNASNQKSFDPSMDVLPAPLHSCSLRHRGNQKVNNDSLLVRPSSASRLRKSERTSWMKGGNRDVNNDANQPRLLFVFSHLRNDSMSSIADLGGDSIVRRASYLPTSAHGRERLSTHHLHRTHRGSDPHSTTHHAKQPLSFTLDTTVQQDRPTSTIRSIIRRARHRRSSLATLKLLKSCFIDMSFSLASYITVYPLYISVMGEDSSQQDASEIRGRFWDLLKKCIASLSNKENADLFSKVIRSEFGGVLYELSEQYEEESRQHDMDFFSLDLTLTKDTTLEDEFVNLTRDAHGMYSRISFDIPEVLCINLNRFSLSREEEDDRIDDDYRVSSDDACSLDPSSVVMENQRKESAVPFYSKRRCRCDFAESICVKELLHPNSSGRKEIEKLELEYQILMDRYEQNVQRTCSLEQSTDFGMSDDMTLSQQLDEQERLSEEISQTLGKLSASKCRNRMLYQLKAVILHRGNPNQGHYWTYVRESQHTPLLWFRLDDEKIALTPFSTMYSEAVGRSSLRAASQLPQVTGGDFQRVCETFWPQRNPQKVHSEVLLAKKQWDESQAYTTATSAFTKCQFVLALDVDESTAASCLIYKRYHHSSLTDHHSISGSSTDTSSLGFLAPELRPRKFNQRVDDWIALSDFSNPSKLSLMMEQNRLLLRTLVDAFLSKVVAILDAQCPSLLQRFPDWWGQQPVGLTLPELVAKTVDVWSSVFPCPPQVLPSPFPEVLLDCLKQAVPRHVESKSLHTSNFMDHLRTSDFKCLGEAKCAGL